MAEYAEYYDAKGFWTDVPSNLCQTVNCRDLDGESVCLGTNRHSARRSDDPSGAVVPKAAVGPGGLDKTTVTADNGSYAFTELPAGNYTVAASAPELRLPEPHRISLRGGVETLNLQLQVASQSEQVTVQDNAGPALTTDPSRNAGATVLRGDDLEALADDPDDLAAD